MLTIHPQSKNTDDYAITDPVCKAPAEKITLLRFAGGLRIIVAAGLDTRQPGWRIRHPHAVTQPGKSIAPSSVQQMLYLLDHGLGHGSGTKPLDGKAPSRVLVGARREVARSALMKITRAIIMIYQFLIASPGRKLAELSRIRVVSAFGRTEAEARAHLAGPNLVFLSRTPARKGGAA